MESIPTMGGGDAKGAADANERRGVNERITDRESVDILMGVVLNTMWNLLAHAYSSPLLPAEMRPKREAMQAAAAFLRT
eukprot:3837683-Prymnesium_polylepis.1